LTKSVRAGALHCNSARQARPTRAATASTNSLDRAEFEAIAKLPNPNPKFKRLRWLKRSKAVLIRSFYCPLPEHLDNRQTRNAPFSTGTNLGKRLFIGRQHSRVAAPRRVLWAVEFCFGLSAFRSRSSFCSRLSGTKTCADPHDLTTSQKSTIGMSMTGRGVGPLFV
jgi:hypothetical protein